MFEKSRIRNNGRLLYSIDLVCEFAFALLYFLLGGFSKIDLHADFHNGMENFAGIPFPDELKLSEVIPLFKMEDPLK